MNERQSLVVSFVGDVMLARNVGDRLATLPPSQLLEEGVWSVLKASELRCANLESPIADASARLRGDSFQAPLQSAELLRIFDLVSLANNHIDDCGDRGIDQTISALRERNISYAGVSVDGDAAYRHVTLTGGGLRCAFLGCTSLHSVPHRPVSRYTLAMIENAEMDRAVARARNEADIVVILVHGGIEYVPYPPPWLRIRAKELIDAGATLIATHHAHVLGGHETPRPGRLIWYGLGDFIFDSYLHERRKSGILNVAFNASGVLRHELIPAYANEDYQVRLVPGKVKREIEEGVVRVSKILAAGDYDRRFRRRCLTAFVSYQANRLKSIWRRQGAWKALAACCHYTKLALRQMRRRGRRLS